MGSVEFLRNKVAVVFDDHKLFADSFAGWLEKTSFFNRVYSFTDTASLMKFFFAKRTESVYLISDFYIGEGNTLGILSDIKRIYPSVKLVILSSITNSSFLNKILELNPRGILSKTAGMDEVFECLHAIEANRDYISPHISTFISTPNEADALSVFTRRELEILDYFAKGNSIAKTAELLNLSSHTIVSHRRNMMSKTNCNSIVELLAYARKANII